MHSRVILARISFLFWDNFFAFYHLILLVRHVVLLIPTESIVEENAALVARVYAHATKKKKQFYNENVVGIMHLFLKIFYLKQQNKNVHCLLKS